MRQERRCVNFKGLPARKLVELELQKKASPQGILYRAENGQHYVINRWGRVIWLEEEGLA